MTAMAHLTKTTSYFGYVRRIISEQNQLLGRGKSAMKFSVGNHTGISYFPQCYCSTSNNSMPTRATSKVLYDGDCRICQIEISALKKLTQKKKNIEFINISSPEYDSQMWSGVSYEDAMKEMHVVGPDGKVYTQASAIRHMYRACGFGWLASLTELPVIEPVCDILYVRFARYRLRKALDRCDSNSCDIKLKHLRDKLEKEKDLRG